MSADHAIDDAGPLPLCALEELQDYLHIFEETSRSGNRFRHDEGRLIIEVDGEMRGYWTLNGDSLVFHGDAFAHVRSLQAAVLHTLGVLAQSL